jgi:hypothetical protein
MKCHAGVEFPSGKPCPKCNAGLGEVCWPGINADLLELPRCRDEIERLRNALDSSQSLLVAILSEKRPMEEIETQIAENREALTPGFFDGDTTVTSQHGAQGE